MTNKDFGAHWPDFILLAAQQKTFLRADFPEIDNRPIQIQGRTSPFHKNRGLRVKWENVSGELHSLLKWMSSVCTYKIHEVRSRWLNLGPKVVVKLSDKYFVADVDARFRYVDAVR